MKSIELNSLEQALQILDGAIADLTEIDLAVDIVVELDLAYNIIEEVVKRNANTSS